VHGDKLRGLLQFEGEDAKFLHEDVVDCVASNGSTQDCQMRYSMRGEDLVCLSSSGVSYLRLWATAAFVK
jgi:hypothetical protein